MRVQFDEKARSSKFADFLPEFSEGADKSLIDSRKGEFWDGSYVRGLRGSSGAVCPSGEYPRGVLPFARSKLLDTPSGRFSQVAGLQGVT